MIRARPLITCGLLWAALPGGAFGQDDASAALLADGCVSCHGPEGRSPGAIPSLDSLDPAEIAAALHGFRDGELEATIMTRIALGLSNAQIDMLEHYYETTRQE